MHTQSQLFSLVREMDTDGRLIAVVNDFDQTISHNGPSQGANPFDSYIDLLCGNALREMEKNGIAIGAISNRSGAQIAARYHKAGIKHPFIVGTYGLEIYYPSVDIPYQGRSVVDEHINQYSGFITKILRRVRKEILYQIGMQFLPTDFVEVILPTKHGPIYLENKCLSQEYPEGLAQVYNFNRIPLDFRTQLTSALKKIFSGTVDQLQKKNPDVIEKFLQVWGIAETGIADQKGSYALAFEPLIKQGKAYGMKKLLHALERSSVYNNRSLGLIIYGGDANADGEVMHANRELEKSTQGKVYSVGIWVNPGYPQKEAAKFCDITVSRVEEYGKFLSSLSRTIEESM